MRSGSSRIRDRKKLMMGIGCSIAALGALVAWPIANAVDNATSAPKPEPSSLAIVDAASYGSTQYQKLFPGVAAGELVSGFGAGLATRSENATQRCQTTLADRQVVFHTAWAKEKTHLACILYMGPGQANFQVPTNEPTGYSSVEIIDVKTPGRPIVARATVKVNLTSPGIFTADASGTGRASGNVLRRSFNPDGSYVDRYESLADPIDMGPASDQLFLLLYGTGFRNNPGTTGVTAKLAGQAVDVLYAGPQGDFTGVDQLNVRVPRDFTNKHGEVSLEIALEDGAVDANKITVAFK